MISFPTDQTRLLATSLIVCSILSAEDAPLVLNVRTRVQAADGSREYHAILKKQNLNSATTAVVVCDMWDAHWCKGATRRVAEMAPRVNQVLHEARKRGMLIIHAPSNTLGYYKDTPQRKLAQAAPKVQAKVPLKNWCHLDKGRESSLPIDDRDGGCDCDPKCRSRRAWTKQIESIDIKAGDAITDNAEAYYLMKQRGIENVIVLGVHTNMCVLGRPFSVRQMAYQGMNVLLMRDLTDTMYNSRRSPFVSHFTGTDLVVEHIEKFWCPTITSADLLGGESFRFKNDKRKHIVFVIAEMEYKTKDTLPPFATKHLGRDFRVSFVHASPKDRNDLPGLEVLDEADLALFSIRRRAPPKEQMAAIRRFVESGKPLVAIRTTSHAFALRSGKPREGHTDWPEFDAQILGGNYAGHHGNKGSNGPKTFVWATDAAAKHPIMKGMPTGEFVVRSWLYKAAPLSKTATTLMMGRVEDRKPHQPVAWINQPAKGGKVFYTSLGHVDDFRLPAFQTMLRNSIYWAAGLPINKVRRILRELPGKVSNTGFADSTGGMAKDKVHFDRKSLIMLGETYAAAYEVARNDSLTDRKKPPALSTGRRGFAPEAALKKLHVADGLKVELFASEPMVRQPVTMTVDNRNRVWVIQYLQYPEPAGLKKVSGDRYDRIRYDRLPKPPPHGPRGADRITILEDTDGDGRADKASDFIDGLNLASGLALGHGGAWVLQSPYLLFYPDQNNDDKPDSDPEVRLVGFGLDDAHSVANSLQWGPDGWLYGVHGSTVNADVRGVKFQQGIWRYHPATDCFELFSEGGGNTYGLDFDRLGNAIAGTNAGVPGLHQMQGAYHSKNFGKHGALHNPHTFGYFGHMPHSGSSIGKLSVGGIFYQAEQWPPKWRNKYITANPLNHALYAIDVQPRGSTFSTKFQERLVWSDDAWFQPVDLALEANGSLLIADWYDGNISYQRTYRDRKNFDAERGRIYRISAKARPGPNAVQEKTRLKPLLQPRATHELFHPNILRARRALQSLAERHDRSLAPKHAKLLDEAKDERNALHALWALNLCQSLNENDGSAIRSLQHRFPIVRAWTARLLGDQLQVSTAIRDQLVKLARDETDVRVRAQLACAAKRLPGEDCLAIATELARHDADQSDPYVPLLLWWAVESKSVTHREQILSWLKSPKEWVRPLMQKTIIPRLTRRYAAEGGELGFATCTQLLALAPTSSDVERVISGMEKQLQGLRQGKMPDALRAPLARLWKGDHHPQSLVMFSLRMGNEAALREAVTRMNDTKVAGRTRVQLIDAIGQTGNDAALKPLLDLFQQSDSVAIQSAVLASLARFKSADVGTMILQVYKSLSRDLRAEARQVLYSRAAWSQALLQAIDGGQLSSTEIPHQELSRLQSHPDPTIRKLVQKTWGKVRTVSSQDKRKQMLEIGRTVLEGTGDVVRGKTQFMNLCGKCHQLHSEGGKFGPDLTPYPRHELSYLLLHTVDPGAVIRPAYQGVVIVTDDERMLTGILAESTPRTVTLLDANNKRTLLARDDIEHMKDSELSPMPENLFSTFKPQAIRDLFAYLRSKTSGPLRNDLSSLTGLHETFETPTDAWRITDNGTQTAAKFQETGGRPGGWLQLNDTSGGRMAIVLPKEWHAELKPGNRTVLSFDARTVDRKNGRPHEAFGLVEITGAGKTLTADAAGPKPIVPGVSWTTYSLTLDARTFRVSEPEWQRILSDLTQIIIRLEAYAGANEIMGVDNISLRAR